jgi:SAM-dependent methyltransferase
MSENATWPDRGQLLELTASYRPACVLGAAAELDLFTRLGERTWTAEEVASALHADLRATQILLDALASLRLLDKQDARYAVPEPLRPLLTADSPETVLPMVRHSTVILRHWSQLAWVVKSGIPGPQQASLCGFEADRAAFLAAMHTASGPFADALVAKLGPPAFSHLLDVGGASGTWTIAFLTAAPGSRATIFDLPDAIVQARQRMAVGPLADRVDFAPGDFYRDELPAGADFAWVSAIIHQHSREQSRRLFAKVYRALVPGGTIAIRDLVMEPCRTRPPFGAMFAVNMLVNTATGGTFTLDEIAEDLRDAGFVDPVLKVADDDMNSVVAATRPAG